MKKKLRAFQIENTSVTQGQSPILTMLDEALKELSTVQDRRMLLNHQDSDEDLLAYYEQHNNGIFCGMMMRIIPAEQGGVLSEDIFKKDTIKIDDLDAGEEKQSQYKSHYYFALNGSYLITDLPVSTNIERLQTYINWLLEGQRGDTIFSFTPLMVLPEGLKLKDIRHIEFSGGNRIQAQQTTTESYDVKTSLLTLRDNLLDELFGSNPSLQDLKKEQLVSAKLLLQIQKRPKGMDKDTYQNLLGAIAKNVNSESGFSIKAKNGTTYNGQQINRIREVEVEETSKKRVNEQQLWQEMERFLQQVAKENE